MGSSRLPAGIQHLHCKFNFTESQVETAQPSLHRSCGSELTRQGISLPLDHYSYGRRLPGLLSKAQPLRVSPPWLTFWHWAGVTPYTSSYEFAECCVFSKQSQPPGIFDRHQLREQVPSPIAAHLLPKLRCHFA
jgi:hypothetical protein